MRNIWVITVVIFCLSCGTNKKNGSDESNVPVADSVELVTFKYKVDGLQDSIVHDSIWKIIFQVQGVDKLVLSKADSTALFTVDPQLVTDARLTREITSRGGVLVE